MLGLVMSVLCKWSSGLVIYTHLYSIESCREAFTHSQGMVLFGSKLKLIPLEVDGKLHMYNVYCSYPGFFLFHRVSSWWS